MARTRAHQAGRLDQPVSPIAEIARRLPDDLPLVIAFHRDGDKPPERVDWFAVQLARIGVTAGLPALRSGPTNRS